MANENRTRSLHCALRPVDLFNSVLVTVCWKGCHSNGKWLYHTWTHSVQIRMEKARCWHSPETPHSRPRRTLRLLSCNQHSSCFWRCTSLRSCWCGEPLGALNERPRDSTLNSSSGSEQSGHLGTQPFIVLPTKSRQARTCVVREKTIAVWSAE